MANLTIQTTKTFNDLNTNKRIIILRGGTRSGKSYSTIQYLIVKCLETPNIIVSVIRKSLPSLKKSIFRDFKSVMKSLELWNEDNYMSTEMTYTFDNGSIVEFFSVADAQRIRGSARTYLFCDEANELSYEDFFQANIRTTVKSIIAFNPSFNRTTHWIYNKIVTRNDAEEFISTYKDNTFLEQSLVNEIELLKETSPSLYTIYAEGNFGSTEGLIFDNFSVIDILPEEVELLGYGMDFGFTQDPTTLVALFKYNSEIIAHELLYKKGLLSKNIADIILNNYTIYGKQQVVADSADPRLISEISQYNNVVIIPAVKGPHSIKLGIDIIKQHKLLITKQSTNLLNELYNYTFDKDKEGNLLNNPVGGNDHIIDALRYICTSKLSSKQQNYGTYTFSFV